jgi:hypothetical protein
MFIMNGARPEHAEDLLSWLHRVGYPPETVGHSRLPTDYRSRRKALALRTAAKGQLHHAAQA